MQDIDDKRDTLDRYATLLDDFYWATIENLDMARELIDQAESLPRQTIAEPGVGMKPELQIPRIEMPSKRRFREMETMEIGESVFYPGATTNQTARVAFNPYHAGKRFISRTVYEATKKTGVRVWRVE